MSLVSRADWPARFLRTRVEALPLPSGDAGTELTVERMRDLVDRAKKDPLLQQWLAYLLRACGVPPFDWMGEARAIWDAVLSQVRYTEDPVGKETLRAPRDTLLLGIADCDDFTILFCGLLESLGKECRIVTISQAGAPPLPYMPEWTHVYPETRIDGRWIALDAARKKPQFGAQPRHFSRKAVWSTWSDEYDELMPIYLERRTTPNLSGLARARRSRVRRMGIDASDWASLLNASTVGTADIITAARASPLNLVPSTGGATPTGLTPAAQAALYQSGAATPSILSGSNWIWLVLIGGGALLLVSRSKS